MDLAASLEQLLEPGKANSFRDSENVIPALLGKSAKGRDYHVINSTGKALAIRHGKWKFIPAGVAIRDQRTGSENDQVPGRRQPVRPGKGPEGTQQRSSPASGHLRADESQAPGNPPKTGNQGRPGGPPSVGRLTPIQPES